MNPTDPLDVLLREWKAPEPGIELDQRVTADYRSTVSSRRSSVSVWRQFWTIRVSIPMPALIAAAFTIAVLVFWSRLPATPKGSYDTPGVVTRLNASGFQPLPNGEAKIVPAIEVTK